MNCNTIKLTPQSLIFHLDSLKKNCRYMAYALDAVGVPSSRQREEGFKTLLKIVIDQQISVQAGAAIWDRVEKRLGVASPARTLAVGPKTLQKCGLSKQKTAYAIELASAVQTGKLDFKGLNNLDDQTVVTQLTRIKGIGIWTAEIYLMFALGRPDILPASDLALQIASQNLFGLKEKPRPKDLRCISERWAPHRTSAALILWKFYRNPSCMINIECK